MLFEENQKIAILMASPELLFAFASLHSQCSNHPFNCFAHSPPSPSICILLILGKNALVNAIFLLIKRSQQRKNKFNIKFKNITRVVGINKK